MPESDLYNNFIQDKEATLRVAEEFLDPKKDIVKVTEQNIEEYRNDATKLIEGGNFTKAMQTLEKLRDAKTGIVLHETEKDGVPVIIRDARNAKQPAHRSTEAFEMQYLNVIRAAMDIVEIEGKGYLKEELQGMAKEFIKDFSEEDMTSQKDYSSSLKEKTSKIGELLQDHEIEGSYKKLDVAKDFQNFNDKHANIVTISSIKNREKGETHTVVEAEVAMKSLTETQKEDYADIDKHAQEPSWYDAMPSWEQALCKQYAPIILEGKHVIPTQLRQIAGMKNAFEKTTAILENNKLEVLHSSKHAGTLASFSKHKESIQEITDNNAKQAQEWVGQDVKLHCNTFNSGPLGAGKDPKIVKRTKKAMKNIGGKETNTAFNGFRYLGLANDLRGVKDTLKESKQTFSDDKEFKKIKSHIQPRGFFGRLFRTGNTEKEIERLQKAGKLNDKSAGILRNAIDLRRSVEKADSILRFGDGENSSLATSTKLNNLAKELNALDAPSPPPIGMTRVPTKEEILNMCASGKDRTGLAEHDQSAQAISNKTGVSVKDIDGQLLASGHTAQQAGGINSGGATIGCFGTKSENKAGLPKSRKKDLIAIVEVSAQSNKVKKSKKKPKSKMDNKEHDKQNVYMENKQRSVDDGRSGLKITAPGKTPIKQQAEKNKGNYR